MARKPLYVTEVGTAVFPYLIKPDTEFDSDGIYHTILEIDPDSEIKTNKGESVGTLEEFLTEARDEAIADFKKESGKKRVKTPDAPFGIYEETGKFQVKFKQKARIKVDDEMVDVKLAIYDAKGKPFKGKNLGGGSKIKIAFEVAPYGNNAIGAGITLRPKAIQIIELVKGGATASTFGFGEEEGFSADEEDEEDEDETPFERQEESTSENDEEEEEDF